jgi:hypothetical protein
MYFTIIPHLIYYLYFLFESDQTLAILCFYCLPCCLSLTGLVAQLDLN